MLDAASQKKTDKLKKIIPENNIILLNVKLEDSIRAAVHVLKTKLERLDLIINNAGIIGNRAGLNKVEMYDHIETFMTNTIGPLFVTKYCLPLLGKDSTVVNISSLMGSIDDTSGGCYSYRISKAALNMVTKKPTRGFKREGHFGCFLPSWVGPNPHGYSSGTGLHQTFYIRNAQSFGN